MFEEFKKRLEYNLKVLFYKDGEWEMKGHFVSNVINPFSGYWITDNGTFKKYSDIK